MTRLRCTILLLFFPACLGILGQVIWGNELSHQLLALGFFLLGIDQARMAVIDLEQVAKAKRQLPDPRLQQFYLVTVSTIAIELVGFYLAFFLLGWGIVVFFLSQIWFHLLAGIQFSPSPDLEIQTWGISERFPVFIANGTGLFLIGLWMWQIAPLAIVLGLWSIAIVYASVKFVLTVKQQA